MGCVDIIYPNGDIFKKLGEIMESEVFSMAITRNDEFPKLLTRLSWLSGEAWSDGDEGGVEICEEGTEAVKKSGRVGQRRDLRCKGLSPTPGGQTMSR